MATTTSNHHDITVAEISQRLADQAQSVAETLLPAAKRQGRTMVIGSVNGEPGQSLKITITGSHAGQWRDFATGDHGDLIDLFAAVHNCSKGDAVKAAKSFLRIGGTYQSKPLPKPARAKPEAQQPAIRPHTIRGLRKSQPGELEQLAKLRSWPLWGHLLIAEERGLLRFFEQRENEDQFICFAVTDSSNRVCQYRRLDGQLLRTWNRETRRFDDEQVTKGKTSGTPASWPVGSADFRDGHSIMFCEGLPDLLAAIGLAFMQNFQDSVDVCAMLGAGQAEITPDAIERFRGKRIRFYVHGDQAGRNAVEKWSRQLAPVAGKIDACFIQRDGAGDLADLLALYRREDPPSGTELLFDGLFEGGAK